MFLALSKASLVLVLAEALGQLKWRYFQQAPRQLLTLHRFDATSRGPIGALSLLARARFKCLATSFGCIATMLAIALDPLTQQVLWFPTSSLVVSNGSASIAASTALGGTGFSYTWSSHTAAASRDPKACKIVSYFNELVSAMVAGAIGQVRPAPYVCLSGECSWPEFKTLGFCNKCVDISDLVTASLDHVVIDVGPTTTRHATYSLPNWTSGPWNASEITGRELQKSILTFATDFTILGNFSITPYPYWSIDVGKRAHDSYTGSHGTVLASFQALCLKNMYRAWNRSMWNAIVENIRPQALECSVTMCEQVHAYSRYFEGTLHDPVTSSRDLIIPGWGNESLGPFPRALTSTYPFSVERHKDVTADNQQKQRQSRNHLHDSTKRFDHVSQFVERADEQFPNIVNESND